MRPPWCRWGVGCRRGGQDFVCECVHVGGGGGRERRVGGKGRDVGRLTPLPTVAISRSVATRRGACGGKGGSLWSLDVRPSVVGSARNSKAGRASDKIPPWRYGSRHSPPCLAGLLVASPHSSPRRLTPSTRHGCSKTHFCASTQRLSRICLWVDGHCMPPTRPCFPLVLCSHAAEPHGTCWTLILMPTTLRLAQTN